MGIREDGPSPKAFKDNKLHRNPKNFRTLYRKAFDGCGNLLVLSHVGRIPVPSRLGGNGSRKGAFFRNVEAGPTRRSKWLRFSLRPRVEGRKPEPMNRRGSSELLSWDSRLLHRRQTSIQSASEIQSWIRYKNLRGVRSLLPSGSHSLEKRRTLTDPPKEVAGDDSRHRTFGLYHRGN